MSVAEPTAVERIGMLLQGSAGLAPKYAESVADDLVAAIRAMSPQQQAELIGGGEQALKEWRQVPQGVEPVVTHTRAFGPWREVRRDV